MTRQEPGPGSLTIAATAAANERMSGFYRSMQVWEARQPASLLWLARDLPPPQRPQWH